MSDEMQPEYDFSKGERGKMFMLQAKRAHEDGCLDNHTWDTCVIKSQAEEIIRLKMAMRTNDRLLKTRVTKIQTAQSILDSQYMEDKEKVEVVRNILT